MLRGYDPVREEAHWTLICAGITLGLLTAGIWFEATQSLNDPESIATSQILLAVSFLFLLALPTYHFVSWIFSFLGLRRRVGRALHLRQTALEGSASLCSPPSQDPLPIALPSTVRMHIGKGFLKQYRPGLVWTGIAITFLFLIQGNLSFADHLRFTSVLLIPFLLSPLVMLAKLVEARYTTPTLTLDDYSITARYLADRVTMRWDDVRCFMLTDQDRPGSAWTFELSDGKNTIRWVDTSATANNPYVPIMESSQYAALMQTLPHWICTRTGLPLYNLRSQ